MSNKKFNSIWDAVEDSGIEAENMRLRAELMIVLVQFIHKNNTATQCRNPRRRVVTRNSQKLRPKGPRQQSDIECNYKRQNKCV